MADKEKAGSVLAERFAKAAMGFSRNRSFNSKFVLIFDDVRRLVTVEAGKVVAIEEKFLPMKPYDFSIWASGEAWHELWKKFPKPLWHDIHALSKFGNLRIEGDTLPMFQNMQYIRELLFTPRCKEEK